MKAPIYIMRAIRNWPTGLASLRALSKSLAASAVTLAHTTKRTILGVLLSGLSISGIASAATLTFDDLLTGANGLAAIQSPYDGFVLTCETGPCQVVSYVTYDNAVATGGSGYQGAAISGTNVLTTVNNSTTSSSTLTISVAGGGYFNLNSIYLTAAWRNGMNVSLVGMADTAIVYNTGTGLILGDAGVPTFFNPNWKHISSLIITASGGTNGPFAQAQTYELAVDNLTYNGSSPVVSQADYLGEGKAGYTVWRPSTGYWYSIDGNGKSLVMPQWGAPTDLPVVGDFDGDGKTDIAVYRPANGTWYILYSSTNYQSTTYRFGTADDIPVAGDFDGDGISDLALYRPATGEWLIRWSSDGGEGTTNQWGATGDIPVVGDFDGDGRTDRAVFRPSTGYWYILQSTNGVVVATHWGESTDVPVSGDFDGDGKTDIAVYRPSTGYWYIIQSSDGQVVAKQWGAVDDVPVARDYDADGKTDIAVWRPSTGYWYVIESSTGQTTAVQWGAPTDIPVNSLAR